MKIEWEHGFIIQPRNWTVGCARFRYVYDERLNRGEWQDGNGCFLEVCPLPPTKMLKYSNVVTFVLAFTTEGNGFWTTQTGVEICPSRLKESTIAKQMSPAKPQEIKLPRKIINILDSPYHDCAVFYDGDEAVLFIVDRKGHVSSWDLFTGKETNKDLDLLSGYCVKVTSWKELKDATRPA